MYSPFNQNLIINMDIEAYKYTTATKVLQTVKLMGKNFIESF